MPLPDYSEDPECPKCGATGIKDKPDKRGITPKYIGSQWQWEQLGSSEPCMKMVCDCNYIWPTKTKDAV